MPRNIDVLRKLDSTDFANFLALEREQMAQSFLEYLGLSLSIDQKIAIRAVIKNWLESEVDG